MKRNSMRCVCLLGLAVLLGVAAPQSWAATFVVDSTADDVDAVPGDGTCATAGGACTLRAAIQEANAFPGPDMITLPAGVYLLTIAGINENAAATGDLDVTETLTINSAGAAVTIVDGGGLDRVFHLPSLSNADLTLSGLTIRGGATTNPGGAIAHDTTRTLTITDAAITNNTGADGGALGLSSDGIVIIDNTLLTNNTSSAGGGAIGTSGSELFVTLTLSNCTVSGNTSASRGGGIDMIDGVLTITNCAITGNVATDFGGGVHHFFGTVNLTQSTVSGNTSLNASGGGMSNTAGGSMVITQSTITGNTAQNGGGIASDGSGTLDVIESTVSGNIVTGTNGGGGILTNGSGTLTIVNSTLSANDAQNPAGTGGGLKKNSDTTISITNSTFAGNSAAAPGSAIADTALGGSLTLVNTIVAGGVMANCVVSAGGVITSGGNNIDDGNSCGFAAAGDLPNTNPMIGPLQNNGGPTDTHNLLAGSPAINAGNNALCPATDQRGLARPMGAVCDIGAVEATVSIADLAATVSDTPDPVNTGGNVTYTITVSNAGPAAASSVVVDNTLPAAVTFVSATPSAGACGAPAAGSFTCNLGTLNSGANATVTVVVTTTGATAASITYTASVSAAETDPNPTDNSASTTTTVTPVADLAVTLNDAPDPVVQGTNLTYTAPVTNAGPSAAAAVAFTMAVPAGTTFVSASATAGTCGQAAGTIACNLGTINSGASVTVSVVVTVTGTGSASATASVSSSTSDPAAGNNSATATTTINPSTGGSFAVSAAPGAQIVSAGQAASFTVTVAATGGSFTSPVALSVSGLPPGASAIFAPNSVTPNATSATSMLTVSTSFRAIGAPRAAPPQFLLWWLAALAAALALCGAVKHLPNTGRRRWVRLGHAAALGLLVILAGFTAACANGGFPLSNTTGTYTITITGTSGATQQSTTVTLAVQ